MAEINEELALLQTQIAERKRVLPVSESIKEIFPQHGVTVTAVFLIAGGRSKGWNETSPGKR